MKRITNHEPRITVIDYGMGNLRSVQKALEAVGAKVKITSEPADLPKADAVVLPGVGAFDVAMANLRKAGLVKPLQEVLAGSQPFLGICLGFQLLFDYGEEGKGCHGLGIIPGRVVRFDFGQRRAPKVPHMGWNSVSVRPAGRKAGLRKGQYFYFVHSYYPVCEDRSWIASTTDYGISFCSSVAKKNIFACQFHPEKSSANGLALLRSFLRHVC